MEVAAGAMRPLLRKLGELLVAEFSLGDRVKKRVESLRTELDMMYVFLHKVGDVPPDKLDPQVRIWAAKVRELSYNMEDAVDAHMVRVYDGSHGDLGPNNLKNRVKKFFKRTKKLFSNGKALHQIFDTIQDAQDCAKELGELRQRYALEVRADGVKNDIDPRLKAVYTDVKELVGIEGTRDELTRKLFDGDEMSRRQLKTLSIVGFGGLGKTTLVRAMYDKIEVQFDCRVFVSVSRNPDITKIFKTMLHGLDSSKFANINEAVRDNKQLIDELRAFLQDKRYLIVIDDIWSEDAWEIIKYAFTENDLGSRVITTTRITSVSEACRVSSGDIIHKMKSLDDNNSRRLFYKRIFPRGSGCPVELEQVSEEILKKCGGVPLAIITIASLLAGNDQQIKSKDQWDKILGCIGRGLAEGRTVEDMKRILSFSYYDLPSHLKTCLLYLSIFPEDSWINRDRLIWRWIAEGFIQGGDQGIRLFELGERYFSELLNRNLIQPGYDDNEGGLIYCHVHDMVLDLICSLSSEDNFVTIFDGTKQSKMNSDNLVRRLSFQNNISEPNTHWVNATSMSKLRSITLFRTDVYMIQTLSSFELLRVLDLQWCDLRKSGHHIDLRCIEKLLHLRYLGLQGTYVDVRPIGIGKLQFLQTLDLQTGGSMEVPISVVRLGRLICLYVYPAMRLPDGIGNLVSLEVLKSVTVGGTNGIEKELGKLVELRVLRLLWEAKEDERVCESLLVSLGNLQKLCSLSISNWEGGRLDVSWDGWVPPPHLHTFEFNWCTSTLPRWVNSSLFPVLSYLELRVDKVRPEVDIQILGKIPTLLSLFLGATGHQLTPVESFIIGDDAFPCLRRCTFLMFETGPSMFPRGSMPRLEYLRFEVRAARIVNNDLDVDMGHLPSLQEVQVCLWSEEYRSPEVLKAYDMLELALASHQNHPKLLQAWHRVGPEDLEEEEGPAAVVTVNDREGEPVVL
ncbi:hypothetical protein ACQJBY_040082 [Aegilops geniculata]